MKYTALLLDMDGTFLDFKATEHAAFFRTFRELGYTVDEDIYQIYSKLNAQIWEEFERGEITREALLPERFNRLLVRLGWEGNGRTIEDIYQIYLGEGHDLVKDAMEVLLWLKERYPLYVVTNGVEETQRNRLQLSGVDRLMDDIFISQCIGYQKPQKEFFDIALGAIPEVHREKLLIIGDSLTSDIQGGINAGIDTCWFNPDDKPVPTAWAEENRACGHERPDYIIHALAELKDIL